MVNAPLWPTLPPLSTWDIIMWSDKCPSCSFSSLDFCLSTSFCVLLNDNLCLPLMVNWQSGHNPLQPYCNLPLCQALLSCQVSHCPYRSAIPCPPPLPHLVMTSPWQPGTLPPAWTKVALNAYEEVLGNARSAIFWHTLSLPGVRRVHLFLCRARGGGLYLFAAHFQLNKRKQAFSGRLIYCEKQ